MADRKYSIDEIDRMRRAVHDICRNNDLVEDRLRTYMLNGTEPEELMQYAKNNLDADIEWSCQYIEKYMGDKEFIAVPPRPVGWFPKDA